MFDSELPAIIDEKLFFSKVVPFFEQVKADLLEILGDNVGWKSFIADLHLVVIDNSNVNRPSHLYLSRCGENSFLQNKEPKDKYHGFSSEDVRDGSIYSAIRMLLRRVFIDEVLTQAKPQDIAEFVRELLETTYRFIDYFETKEFLVFRIPHIRFSDASIALAISAYRINIVIPVTSELDARKVLDDTAYNQKVLFTNKKNQGGYQGFDQVIDCRHLTSHFALTNFPDGFNLYQKVLKKEYKDVFKISELLRTTSYGEIYDLKRRLVNLSLSNGKAFEDYLEKFLLICFGSSFKNFVLLPQAANEGRLRIRDFIIDNNSTAISPFLIDLKKENVDLLLFDAKNYEGELITSQLDTFREYIRENPHFGNLGVVLSRKGVSKNCNDSIFRNLIADKLKILVLDENDLLTMLRYLDSGRNPIDVLEQKFMELIRRP